MRGFARSNRARATDAETCLWSRLRDRRLGGRKFRRQHVCGPYILDFFCPETHLAIELDGGSHTEEATQAYDEARTEWLLRQGIRVLRFWNDDVLLRTDTVLEIIAGALETPRDGAPSPRPSPPRGRGRSV